MHKRWRQYLMRMRGYPPLHQRKSTRSTIIVSSSLSMRRTTRSSHLPLSTSPSLLQCQPGLTTVSNFSSSLEHTHVVLVPASSCDSRSLAAPAGDTPAIFHCASDSALTVHAHPEPESAEDDAAGSTPSGLETVRDAKDSPSAVHVPDLSSSDHTSPSQFRDSQAAFTSTPDLPSAVHDTGDAGPAIHSPAKSLSNVQAAFDAPRAVHTYTDSTSSFHDPVKPASVAHITNNSPAKGTEDCHSPLYGDSPSSACRHPDLPTAVHTATEFLVATVANFDSQPAVHISRESPITARTPTDLAKSIHGQTDSASPVQTDSNSSSLDCASDSPSILCTAVDTKGTVTTANDSPSVLLSSSNSPSE